MKYPGAILLFFCYARSAYAQQNGSLNMNGNVGADRVMEVVVGLVIVLLAIMIIAWLARNYLNIRSMGGSGIRVVGGVSLGGKERVVVVEVSGEQVMLGVSPGRINKIHILENKIEERSPAAKGGFLIKLNEEIARRRKK